MAKHAAITDDERVNAVPVSQFIPAGEPIYGSDADTEAAWEKWRSDMDTSEVQGKIRVAKVPCNEDGTPNIHAKGQVQLLTVPHDQYDFDELCNVIRSKFMEPGETICVRIMGTRSGYQGTQFNRIMMIAREKGGPVTEVANSQTNELLRMMREAQDNQVKLLQGLLENKGEPAQRESGMDSFVKLATVIGPIVSPIIAAWIARPQPKSDLAGIVDVMMKLNEFKGGSNDNAEDSGVTGIIKAVAPAAIQGLTQLAALRQVSPAGAQGAPIPARAPAPRLSSPQPAPNANGSSESPVLGAGGGAMDQVAPVAADTSSEGDMLSKLKEVVAELIVMCDRGEDPVQVALLTSDIIPEQYDEKLYDLVSSPESFAKLRFINAGVADPKRAAWFEQLRVELLKSYDEPATADETIASLTPST